MGLLRLQSSLVRHCLDAAGIPRGSTRQFHISRPGFAFAPTKPAHAIARAAIGDYAGGEGGEPVLHSPSESAHKISAKVLPKIPRLDVKVLIVGSGGLSIGQAAEFDYSGS